jgi:hypothetical protein
VKTALVSPWPGKPGAVQENVCAFLAHKRKVPCPEPPQDGGGGAFHLAEARFHRLSNVIRNAGDFAVVRPGRDVSRRSALDDPARQVTFPEIVGFDNWSVWIDKQVKVKAGNVVLAHPPG